jgi:hypothetical protein
MCELETKKCPIDELPPEASPVPIPAPTKTQVSTSELEIKRTPIEELPPLPPAPGPMPGLYIPSAEPCTTIVEFQITILSTLDIPAEPEAVVVPIENPSHSATDPIVEFQIVMLSTDEIPSRESSP